MEQFSDIYRLKHICRILRICLQPKAIYIVGSRAGNVYRPDSDYDFLIYLGIIRTIFMFPKLKALEKQIKHRLGIELSIGPLTPFRLYWSKSNLFLFKVKQYSKLLYGIDVRDKIRSNLQDISTENYISYLICSLMKILNDVDIREIFSEKQLTKQSSISVLKGFLACAEVELFLNNQFYKKSEDLLIQYCKVFNHQSQTELFKVLEKLDPTKFNHQFDVSFWFLCKDSIIRLLSRLIASEFNYKNSELTRVFELYSQKTSLPIFGNYRYVISKFLMDGRLDIMRLMQFKRVDRFYRMLLCLLASAISPEGFNDRLLDTLFENLFGNHSKDNVKGWESILMETQKHLKWTETVL